MFLALVATVLVSSFSFGQGLEESVVAFSENYVPAKDGSNKVAQSFTFRSFNPKYKLLPTYAINLVDFTDDGKHNDMRAGDGVYTSVQLITKPNDTKVPNLAIFSDKFIFTNDLMKFAEANRPGLSITVHCKMRIVYTGTTLLGFGCSGGCIELYDCDITVGYNRDNQK